MNRLLGGAFSLVLIACAGAAAAQVYGPPPAGYPPAYDPPLAGDVAPRFQDSMRGREAYRAPPPGPCAESCNTQSYGYVTRSRDDYDASGYDAEGFDKYGFDHAGLTRDGYDIYGYDQYGRDRYGRLAPARRDIRDDRRDAGRYGYSEERYVQTGGASYAGDRYGPPPARDDWDEPADGYYVPTFGGALQHYGDPRCNTCTVRYRDCGCAVASDSSFGTISVSPAFFYDNGGVGPIPDGGYYGGGGMVVMGGASAHSSASASAYASSRSSVSIRVGGGKGGHWGGKGGGKGGCGSCGGGHH